MSLFDLFQTSAPDVAVEIDHAHVAAARLGDQVAVLDLPKDQLFGSVLNDAAGGVKSRYLYYERQAGGRATTRNQ